MQNKSRDTPLAVALFLLLFSIYLLTFSGSLHSSDGQAMFSVSESLVRRGAYDINQIRWMGLQQGTFGPDGNLYCRKGLGTSLVALPLAWLGFVVPTWGMVQTAMLLNVMVTALTGTLVFLYVRRLGYRPSTALVSALVFGLGTMAWPYAKYFFSEPLNGLSLLAAGYYLLRVSSTQGKRGAWIPALLAGLSLGVAVATRFANAVLVPIYLAVLLCYVLRGQDSARWGGRSVRPVAVTAVGQVLAFGLPLVVWAVVMVAYNYARFGDPFTTGYLPEESFSAPWATGILGLLISPGRGLLFFCPVLAACVPAAPAFVRRHRLEAILLLTTSVFYVLVYGKWFMWHGGFAWGPRFLVPIMPLLCVTLAPLAEGLKGRMRAAFWALFGVSTAVQVLGLSVHFIHHQDALLQTGLPLFDPVTFFHPGYSQLWGTLAFLRPENLDFAWVQAAPAFTVDYVSEAASLLLLSLAASALAVVFRDSASRSRHKVWLFVLLPLLTVGGTALLLGRYKNDGHGDYVQMLAYLQAASHPSDGLVQNSPVETAIMQNHYKGRLPVYGLFEGDQPLSADTVALLDRVTRIHGRFWLIPNRLPPHLNSLDRWFTDQGWSAVHYSFGDQRLTLYSRARLD